MRNIEVRLDKDLSLQVSGFYVHPEVETGKSESFEIMYISLVEGELLALLDWAEAQKGKVLVALEEKCLKQLSNK